MERTGLDIISKLARLGQRKQECLQWIPLHVGVPGNEVADELAGWGCDLPNPSSSVLSHSEIRSFHRAKMNLTWRNLSAHHWYEAKSPGLSLQFRRSRALQTALACLRSSHLRGMTFVQGVKPFFTCPISLPTSPSHHLDYWGISRGQLFGDQDLVCGKWTRFETTTQQLYTIYSLIFLFM
ncbi:RNase H domain-containing protein [Trichonephila clavipes]|nr:RNase H domain-containing protein [Trichonephila clavipes]